MKIIIISVDEGSHWTSVKIITQSLQRAYEALDKHAEITAIKLSKFTSEKKFYQLAAKIAKIAPDWIVFIDTWNIYGGLLAPLAELYKNSSNEKPKLRFHTYGDATLKAPLWKSWSNSLKGFKVEWACASRSQANLVSTFLHSSVWVCPFAFEEKKFKFDQKIRNKFRKKLRWEKNDTVFLYTGRLTLQKNVIALLRAFAKIKNTSARLVFVGDFDDFSAPFPETVLKQGEFYQEWLNELAHLDQDVLKRIEVHHSVEHESLQGLYSAADCFVSCSLQHDEDFGMAPAEAAASGLPLVLTAWGGYQCFREYEFNGKWIKVLLTSNGPNFQLNAVTAAMQKYIQQPRTFKQRAASALLAKKIFSIQSVSDLIQKHTLCSNPPVFNGFHKKTQDLSQLFDINLGALQFKDTKKGSLYHQLYSNYAE